MDMCYKYYIVNLVACYDQVANTAKVLLKCAQTLYDI